jgi:hypothetical protein
MHDLHAGAMTAITLDAHLEAAGRLAEISRSPRSLEVSTLTDADFDLDKVVDVTVRAAFVSMQQLQIALRLTMEATQRTQLVLRITDRACATGASPAAVGASALLLETVRQDGVEHAVRVAANALSELGPRTLLDGSIALVASLSVEIAELLGIASADVSAEIVRLVAALPPGPVVPPDDRRQAAQLAVCG